MPVAPYGEPNWWLTCILVDPAQFGADREQIRLALEAADIESRPTWKPFHLQPVFAGVPTVGGTVCAAVFDRGLCLPSGSALAEGDLERIVEVDRLDRAPEGVVGASPASDRFLLPQEPLRYSGRLFAHRTRLRGTGHASHCPSSLLDRGDDEKTDQDQADSECHQEPDIGAGEGELGGGRCRRSHATRSGVVVVDDPVKGSAQQIPPLPPGWSTS